MRVEEIKVSVIVPIYKVEKYIERCARSLFEQTLTGIEFIFVNDCSPDRSLLILKRIIDEYVDRSLVIRIIEHEKNMGLAVARTTGLNQAKGEYIIHCDSDDWIETDMYEDMYMKALKEDADIIICDYYAEYQNKHIYHFEEEEENSEFYLKKILNGSLHNGVWNKLIKKEVYERLSFYYKEGVNMWEDVSIIPRLFFFAEKIVSIHKAFYHYSQVNINAYTKCWKTESLQNVIDVVNVIESFLLENNTCKYDTDLLYLKLRAKYSLLLHSSTKQRRVYLAIYPEVDTLIFRHPALSFYDKIIMWCWSNSFNWGALIILCALSCMKKILR